MARATRRALDLALGAAKSMQKFGSTSWKYLKVEAVPPLTVDFFNGPHGRKIERVVGKWTNGFIGSIQGRIKEIDAEEERQRQEILAAIRAKEEKAKAEAKAKEEARIKEMARKAAEAIKKAAALAEQEKAKMEAEKAKEELLKGKTKKKEKQKPKAAKGRKKSSPKRKPAKKPPKKT